MTRLSDATAPIDEVAGALGLTETQLKRRHRRLTDVTGFPPPLPGGSWRWSRAAFEAWVRASGRPATIVVGNDNQTARRIRDRAALISAQSASLAARYTRGH